MAVNLLGASDARVEFGDSAAIAGLTAITVSYTVSNVSSVADSERIFHQWNGSVPNAFVAFIGNTDEFAFYINNGTTINKGRITPSTNITSGTTYRVVNRWDHGSDVMEIWVNGVNTGAGSYLSEGDVFSLGDAARPIAIGHQTTETIDGIDADYSELVIHNVYMPDDYCVAYGNGFSPVAYRRNGIFYAPLPNVDNLQDLWGGATGTNTAGTSAAHPRIIKPKRRKLL